uniref:Odorant receptor n=1 Tax=Dendrolimus punctatus TaxID=238572 RepID=A0A2K8GL53_9NEOP|nr:Odorant Receptor 58-2 [Dendrolimus punctatus]
MKELDFEKIFKLQMVCMKINLCHPDTKINKYWVLKNIIVYIPYTMAIMFLTNAIVFYLSKKDYFNAFRNVVPVIFYFSMKLNFFFLIKKRSKLRYLIDCMKDDYSKALAMDNKRREVIEEYSDRGRKVLLFWGYLMVCTVGMFLLKSMFLTVYHSKRNGELRLYSFFDMHYPFNIRELRVYNKLYFFVSYFIEMYFTSKSALIFFCTIPLGPIFMLHICGQLELVKMKFEKVFENDNTDEILKDIVQKLQYIYSFVGEINDCLMFIYEVMLKQNILLLPFTSHAIIQSIKRGEITAEFLGILLQSIITSSIPCYYGDLLMQKGDELRDSAYNCGWECVYKPKARKTLLIIMTRALRPVAIQSVFSTICLDTLTEVYSQGYTIFNLMSAVID